MRDLSGTGQVYRFTLSQLLKSRANRVTLIIMVLLAAVSMPLTALLGGETPETSDTAGLASVRVDNRTDLALDFSGDAYWADTDFSAGAGEPDAVVPMFITTLSQTRMKSRFLAADEYISPKKSNSVGASWLKPSRKIAHLRLSSPPYIMEAQRRQAR